MTDTAVHNAQETDRGEFQGLLDDWAAAIVANDADRIAAFAEPGWEMPFSGVSPGQ